MISLEDAEKEIAEQKKRLELQEAKVNRLKELGHIEALTEALNNLEDIRKRIVQLESISVTQDELTRVINDLQIRIDAELEDRKKHRARELETLNKLDKYLDAWA